MRERSLLVLVRDKARPQRFAEESSEELRELTVSAGGDVVGEVTAVIERPDPAFYIRRGKLAEIREKFERLKGNLVIFNVDLSPVQTRNIEKEVGTRIVDRTGLILDIFARRARSHEGRIQVELAQLLYLMPRLTGRGVLLSQLGGGIGTRGPGEKKLEYDRRHIRQQIQRLRGELEKIRTHRRLLRSGRKRKEFSIVAIVGYTNAGKSSLLNALTGAQVAVEDKLFATLDPTTRIFRRKGPPSGAVAETIVQKRNFPLPQRGGEEEGEGGCSKGTPSPRPSPSEEGEGKARPLDAKRTHDFEVAREEKQGGRQILFTDTVGFLVNLPPNLIEAFQATLEEVFDADLIVNVLDGADPRHDQQFRAVLGILEDLEVNGKPQVLALNKVDLLGVNELRRLQEKYPEGVPISAKEGRGLEALLAKVELTLSQNAH